jgi:hypothetical protein
LAAAVLGFHGSAVGVANDSLSGFKDALISYTDAFLSQHARISDQRSTGDSAENSRLSSKFGNSYPFQGAMSLFFSKEKTAPRADNLPERPKPFNTL